MYLWRAVDDEGEILGSDMRPYLDVWTATKFITNLFRWRSGSPPYKARYKVDLI